MNYYVMPKDYADGTLYSLTNCPVARAIRRRHPGAHVYVGSQTVLVVKREPYTELRHTIKDEPLAKRIADIDSGKLTTPFRFTLPF